MIRKVIYIMTIIAISFPCFSKNNHSGRIPDVTKEEYIYYESKLNDFQRLDLDRYVNCQNTDIQYFKKWANDLINIENIQLKNTSKKGKEAERWMLQNLKTKLSYSRLYLAYLEKIKRTNSSLKMPWMSLATHANYKVGQFIQYYYKKFATQEQKKVINPNLQFNRFFIIKNKIAKKTIKSRKNIKVLNEVSLFIYNQFQWQMLAYVKCGISTIKRITQFSEREDYNTIWELLDSDNKNDHLKALSLLINIEQRVFLQKLMYSKKSVIIANFLGILNFHTKVDFKDINGNKLNSFIKYSLKKVRYPQLSNSKLRYTWMIYILKKNWPYLKKRYEEDVSYKDQFEFLKESYNILSTYN